jgi:3-oxoacyl-[acyl-carrier protein] reductase
VRESTVKVIRWDFSRGGLDSFIGEVLSVGVPRLVVLSASYYDSTPLTGISEDLVDYLLKVNLATPLYIAVKLGTAMSEGLIVFLTDMVAIEDRCVYVGLRPSLPYVASRRALTAVVKYLARELAPKVRVVGIAVGWVDNPRASSRLRQRALSSIPTGRFVEPEEICSLIKTAAELPNLNGVFLELSGGL